MIHGPIASKFCVNLTLDYEELTSLKLYSFRAIGSNVRALAILVPSGKCSLDVSNPTTSNTSISTAERRHA
jgi:hypothetical protein